MDEIEDVVEETTEEDTVTLSREEYEKLNQTLGSLKKEVKTYKKEAEPHKESNDSRYSDELAVTRLEVRGIVDREDQRIILEEAKRLQMSAVEVADMEHMKAKLETMRNQRTAESGAPTGTGRKGGAGKGDVDYYLAHPDEVPPDLTLHNQVIDARIKRDTDNNMFSQVPFIG